MQYHRQRSVERASQRWRRQLPLPLSTLISACTRDRLRRVLVGLYNAPTVLVFLADYNTSVCHMCIHTYGVCLSVCGVAGFERALAPLVSGVAGWRVTMINV